MKLWPVTIMLWNSYQLMWTFSPIVPALQDLFDDALSATVSELNFKTIVDGLDAVFYQFPFKGRMTVGSTYCCYR